MRLFGSIAFVLAMILCGFAACGNSAAASKPSKPDTRVEVITNWSFSDGHGNQEREIRINGRDCIETWVDSGGGISCNWNAR